MKIAAHVVFYSGPHVFSTQSDSRLTKLECLKATIRCLRSIEGADVFIHTNDSTGLYDLGENVSVIVHDLKKEAVGRPARLVTLTRPLLYEQRDAYDHFIYTEDDIAFGASSFAYYLKYGKYARQEKAYLDFILYEMRANGGEKMAVELLSTHSRDDLTDTPIDGFSLLEHKDNWYNPFWILCRDDLNSFIFGFPDVFWLRRGLFYGSAERHIKINAAIGPKGNLYRRSVFVDAPGVLVRHLPDKYANRNAPGKTPFGTIPVSAFLRDGLSDDNLKGEKKT